MYTKFHAYIEVRKVLDSVSTVLDTKFLLPNFLELPWAVKLQSLVSSTKAVKIIENFKILYLFYVYGSVHHNIFFEITNRCSYMQSILFHC